MNPYQAPLIDMTFLLEQVFDASNTWQQLPFFSESIDMDTAQAIMEEASNIAKDLIHPLNRNGDEQGVRYIDGAVFTPDGYKSIYNKSAEGGWIGLCGEPTFGGMGMPKMLGVLVDEMAYSACNAFTLYGSLTAGAALCINAHGSEALKQKFLPNLYSGEWAAAMDMSEPQAGSDLRHIRTKAEPMEDGSYSISGSKIFITGGDHDLTENIIHLVLAKIAGTNGISLFLVPKINVDDNGQLTTPNGVNIGGIEHKMGIKGSATCLINYDNARGYLIGKPNRGLICMFTMMNYERLSIGIQGLGSAQAAYQMAAEYAKERTQGIAAGGSPTGSHCDPILVHGDVRRMLLTIRCYVEAGRALAVFTGKQLDLAKYAEGEIATKASRYVGLLTPMAKAFLTDRGFDATVMAQQVFGGHGYIRETGIEQLVRDTRIAQIYEGTNGIQAIDFLGRKTTGDNLKTLTEFLDEIQTELAGLTHVSESNKQQVIGRCHGLLAVADDINNNKINQPALINSCAVDFLDAFGHLVYGYLWLLMADKAATHNDPLFAKTKAQLADFYIAKLLPKVDYHLAQVQAGDETVMAMELTQF